MVADSARIGLVSAWASRLGGGVFEAVVAHSALVRDCGYEPVVLALEDAHSGEDRARLGDVEVVTCPVRGPGQIGYAPAMARRLREARLDLVHLHGIWMYPSRAASDWAAATGRPYVISPHGMLDPWIVSRGTLKKLIARMAYERRSWRLASRFHALTAREAADIGAATGRGDPAFVIPNPVPASPARAVGSGAPFALYLGRIHPKKNLDALVDGWIAADDLLRPLAARLTIAGWGEAEHVAALEARLADVARADIRFVGPVYGERKAALLAGARLLALPSHSEGLPVAILEAWAAGTPTLMSEHCNLPQGFARGAAIDCGTDAASVAAALRTGFGWSAAEWATRSAAARALADDDFSPARVAGQWREVYAALLAAGGTRLASAA